MQQLQVAISSALIAGSLVVWAAILRRVAQRKTVVAYEPRVVVPWIGSDVFVLILLWPILEVILLKSSLSQAELATHEVTPATMVALTAAHLIWTGLAVVYLELRTSARSSEFGFDLSHFAADVGLGLLGFLASILPVYGSLVLVSLFFPRTDHPLLELVRDQPGGPGLFGVAAISAVIAAPLAEELVFRVILQGWLERQLEAYRERRGGLVPRVYEALPILASSTAFAALHQGYERVALFVLALFLGYLYRQTHRIYPSVVLHMGINSMALMELALQM